MTKFEQILRLAFMSLFVLVIGFISACAPLTQDITVDNNDTWVLATFTRETEFTYRYDFEIVNPDVVIYYVRIRSDDYLMIDGKPLSPELGYVEVTLVGDTSLEAFTEPLSPLVGVACIESTCQEITLANWDF